MSTQPEALRLADAIDPFVRQSAPDHLTSTVAAAELRRLHKVNQALLDALKEAYEFANGWKEFTWVTKARAAIAKAQGEQA